MCGIAGIVGRQDGPPVDESALIRLRDAQAHRGPDDAGAWLDERGRVGLAHRRLSIIDLSPSGHQPMSTPDGRLHLVFNGEIYNHRQLRQTLEGNGHRFLSTSDTEVLLHAYRQWGEGMLTRLRGMFAFALFDREADSILLARDPLGIKPLYLAEFDDYVVFSSEIQPIRRTFGTGGTDLEALVSYLHWGSIAAPRTLYRKVRSLQAGHRAWVRSGRLQASAPYYLLREEIQESPNTMSEGEAQERIRAALLDSVSSHMVADVEVGSFLSGGVDSVSLLNLMSEVLPQPVSTVNLAFDVEALNEGDLAEDAANSLGANHRRVEAGIEEVRETLFDAALALDQPSNDGINVNLVSNAARSAGLKVAVSGVGGDELFGGYATFADLQRVQAVHRRLSSLPGSQGLRKLGAYGLNRFGDRPRLHRFRRALQYGDSLGGAYFAVRGIFSPNEARELLDPDLRAVCDAIDPAEELEERIRPGEVPVEHQMAYMETQQYLQMQLLRDADAMSMSHSLEVRTPLVDHVLFRELFSIPAHLRQAGPAKRRLRESTRPALPERFWNRPKMGFTLPMDDWLRDQRLDWKLPQHPLFDAGGLERLEKGFRQGRASWARIWPLIVLTPFLD